MEKEEFLRMSTNRKTIEILLAECRTRFSNNDESHVFFNECAGYLRYYLSLNNKIKTITNKRTTETFYNEMLKIKNNGYRKELVIPF